MAAKNRNLARSFVDNYGLAHTGNFDVSIAGLAAPFNNLMPALGVTFDREQLSDVETIPGLPATVVQEQDNRSITMTLYDTNNRYLESQIRQWMAEASPSLRKATRMSNYVREVTLIERIIFIGAADGTDIQSQSLFSPAGIQAAAAGAASRALRPIEQEARFAVAQAAAQLQQKFHTGWFNVNIDDIQQIPTLRRQIFESALDSQEFRVVERRNTYLAIPIGNIQTNADLSGKGGLSQININLRIVGEQPKSSTSTFARTGAQ